MATINRIRVAQLNPAIAREYERGPAPAGHAYGAPSVPKVDRYTRRSNICPTCRTARALGSGECLC